MLLEVPGLVHLIHPRQALPAVRPLQTGRPAQPPTLGMYGFHSGTTCPVILFRAEEMALSGVAPSTLCATFTTFSSLLKAQAVVPKLSARRCRGEPNGHS